MPANFYRYSYETAVKTNTEDEYLISLHENERCKDYMESPETGIYAKAYINNCVDSNGKYINEVIEKFGMERTMYVIANTIISTSNDGRWSPEIKSWGQNFHSEFGIEETDKSITLSQIHVGIVNILAKHVRQKFEDLKLYNHMHCKDTTEDLSGKIIVINYTEMNEKFWKPEYQLWLATGGFGCSPTASGRAVYAKCLYDGEENRWNREQITGVLMDKLLPDWARKSLSMIQQENIRRADISMMKLPNDNIVNSIKEQYPPGTRVMLTGMDDPYTTLCPGDRGTVRVVDDIGTIHVDWDSGSGLGLAYGEDFCRKLSEEELLEEQGLQSNEQENNEPEMSM